ncbi:TRAP transporter small permease [Jiella sonneratiae]|uniref:TRAP transporter small permease protein n=1 Tax=Jiella sonneratiae TaxID=2816856 RepID=A0ABS3JA00_9HYPH|nr:TRAP transporter small permease [Jiella sonneratiae]MBO0906507.1 TRAP transporter small permease [Jiella sonneratiae]
MLQLLERLCLILRRLASGAVILLFSVMMIAVLVQVVGRYLLNYSIASATEIATFSQIWLVLLGAGVAMARNQHVAIDMLPAMLPLPLARIALLAIAAVTIAFLAVLAYGSLPLLKLGAFQSSPALGLPMKWIYLCLPVGAAYIAIELILSVVRRWYDPFPEPVADGIEEAI